MILGKPRNRMLEGICQSLTLLRSDQGIQWINAEFENGGDPRKVENRINRAFLSCLKQVFKQYSITPLQELPIQPKTGIPYSPSEEKKPDFSLELNDDLHESVFFHIECKRLGSPTSKKWIYNKQYAENGIHRFTTDKFCYGTDLTSGAMVGYVEDMEFDEILSEVNTAITEKLKIEQIVKHSDTWQEKSTSLLSHSFDRPFEKSPFTLHHLWIDLKGCYPRQIKIKIKKFDNS